MTEPQVLTRCQVGRLEIRVMFDANRRIPMSYSAEIREFDREADSQYFEGRVTHICRFSEYGEWKYYPSRKSQPRPSVRADYAAKLAVAAAMSAGSGVDPLSNTRMFLKPKAVSG